MPQDCRPRAPQDSCAQRSEAHQKSLRGELRSNVRPASNLPVPTNNFLIFPGMRLARVI